MINTGKLAGRTVLVTGGSRGIGKAIALKLAKDGANIVVAAKTAEPHPKLPGTIYTACEEIEKAGGKGLACIVDVRDENTVKKAVQEAVEKFGGIDILINNASAISLTGTAETEMKRYDLMHNINTRGTFLVTKECLPYLKKSSHGHVLNISPPLNMKPIWFKNHVAYTMAKYGMSMCVLGMHEEFKPFNIAVNALWPRTAIDTAAMQMLGGKESANVSRKPDIMADAAYNILIKDPKTFTGNFCIDEDVLKQAGVTDQELIQYACNPDNVANLMDDFFLDPKEKVSGDKASSGAAAAPQGQIASLFKKIESSISPQTVQKVQAVYVFNVTGEEAGLWYLDLKNGEGSCGFGEYSHKPDATFTMDSKQFFNMFTGKTKPTTAYMTGKMKIKGDLSKAIKLEGLMTSLKAKL
ncbi:hydroxysteroid dehydrogenase-like protein 2 [Diorhabda carinulata]|uniref:hydroxysteroid dehydrogenase-like protein 2 n=1 Tax=Diorhabda carinulata TaxID=1163345 RepID=UPI0025A26E22|nr:hydroxysteroid dehydrogenase-like protein 2 [Diorhabda carinulata]